MRLVIQNKNYFISIHILHTNTISKMKNFLIFFLINFSNGILINPKFIAQNIINLNFKNITLKLTPIDFNTNLIEEHWTGNKIMNENIIENSCEIYSGLVLNNENVNFYKIDLTICENLYINGIVQ